MISICKAFEFEAAHYLSNHEGKCKNLHGHSYKLEVEISGNIVNDGSSQQGMVVDFGNLKNAVDYYVIKKLDHKVLNDILGFYPTAENMLEYIHTAIFYNFILSNPGQIKLERIRLWETSTSWAEWKAGK